MCLTKPTVDELIDTVEYEMMSINELKKYIVFITYIFIEERNKPVIHFETYYEFHFCHSVMFSDRKPL